MSLLRNRLSQRIATVELSLKLCIVDQLLERLFQKCVEKVGLKTGVSRGRRLMNLHFSNVLHHFSTNNQKTS
jgi:hypothetical protein